MLVIQRGPGQRVVIGGNTVLTIVESSRGRVSLGFEGPQRVDREEVAEKRNGPGFVAGLISRFQSGPRLAF